jgi:hypothetical protein
LQARLVIGREPERKHEPLGGVAVGMGGSALQLLNAVHTQPSPLGQRFLR